MKGVIYMYTSPNGKKYIGQTLNEERRKKEFFNMNKKYAGLKICNARKKFSPENFIYEVLYEKEYQTIEEANEDLNYYESYYISFYDTIKNGYNTTLGGDSIRGVMLSEECRQRIVSTLKKRYREGTLINPFKGKKHTDETKDKIRKKSLGRPSANKGKKCQKNNVLN